MLQIARTKHVQPKLFLSEPIVYAGPTDVTGAERCREFSICNTSDLEARSSLGFLAVGAECPGREFCRPRMR